MPQFSDLAPPEGRLAALMRLLDRDPDNAALLTDVAELALQQQRPDLARRLLDEQSVRVSLAPQHANLQGLAALALADYSGAVEIFRRLHELNPEDSALRFNLAWALAMLKDFEPALTLLSTATTEALPQAATLQVQLLHQAGRVDEALAQAKHLVAIHPRHPGLLAAASLVAVDAEDQTFAAKCAAGAPDHPDAMIAQATMALADDRSEEAAGLFQRALEASPQAPRAWVGVGLGQMLKGDYATAARDIERGADTFGDHIGSWIAAGWAYLLNGDLGAARRCFDKALAIDRNFADSHGSLAVLHLMQGAPAEGRAEMERALRLDPKSFSAVMARAMLLAADNKGDTARALIERALRTPIDASGRTIAQSIARYGISR